jgi:hypothetical protein
MTSTREKPECRPGQLHPLLAATVQAAWVVDDVDQSPFMLFNKTLSSCTAT